jgi:hypothetical protein
MYSFWPKDIGESECEGEGGRWQPRGGGEAAGDGRCGIPRFVRNLCFVMDREGEAGDPVWSWRKVCHVPWARVTLGRLCRSSVSAEVDTRVALGGLCRL